ncbi:MAG: hypothetical protein R3F36_00040 [Candidatus Competibacteraceae bacterium]
MAYRCEILGHGHGDGVVLDSEDAPDQQQLLALWAGDEMTSDVVGHERRQGQLGVPQGAGREHAAGSFDPVIMP